MRTLIATAQVPFVRGGAEILADGLCDALRQAGHEVELVRFPFKWYPPSAIPAQVLAARMLDLTEYSGVKIDRVIGLKFPAYLIPHPNKLLWIIHQHRSAYDFWDSGHSDLLHAPQGRAVRDFIGQVDEKYIPEARAVYTISRNVSDRLQRFNGIASEPVYHPPANAEDYAEGGFESYFLVPSRIDPLKRQWLVLDALAESAIPIRVVFVGSADNPQTLLQLQRRASRKGVSDRVTWMGQVNEAEKIRLYSNACGVIYPPVDEDYGYVTLESMLAAKPVLTCSDSGGALEFVRHEVTGLIVPPTSSDMAKAMAQIWDNRTEAMRLGRAGRDAYSEFGISWENVVRRLCAPV